MEKGFDGDRLLVQLRRLPFRAVLGFALSCAERLGPNYAAFNEAHRWGDSEGLRGALDLGWSVLSGVEVPDAVLGAAEARCQAAEPDTTEFDSLLVSPGLDAACASGMLVQFLRTRDVAIVADIASLCRDTVDMYVQEVAAMPSNAPDLEERILAHPLMQRELARQSEDLRYLERFAASADEVAELARRWRSPRHGNLDLSGSL